MASGIMAEAGAMGPTSDSDLTGLSKVSVLQLLRMSMHERLRAATLFRVARAIFSASSACSLRLAGTLSPTLMLWASTNAEARTQEVQPLRS